MKKLLGLLVMGLAFALAIGSVGCTTDKDKKKDADKKDADKKTETTDKKDPDKKDDPKKKDDTDKKKDDTKKKDEDKVEEGKVTLKALTAIDVTIDKDGKGNKTFDVEVTREKYDDVIKIKVTAPKDFKGKYTIKGDSIGKKEAKTSVDLILEGAEKGTYDFTVEAIATSSEKIKSGGTLKVTVK